MSKTNLFWLSSFLLVGCGEPVCGDARVEGAEACDDGNQDPADGCDIDCTQNACSDGFAQPGEICYSPQEGAPVDGTFPSFLRHGDVNGDGFLDLVIISQDELSLSVVLNDQNGGFPTLKITQMGVSLRDLAIADFDGDGLDDVLVGLPETHTAAILFSNGDGTFARQPDLDTQVSAAFLIAIDADADSDIDLFVDGIDLVQGGQAVILFRNQGDGTFAAPERTASLQIPFGFAVEDLNQDGRLDLAVTNPLDDGVEIFLGQPDGSFFSLLSEGAGDQPELVFPALIDNDDNIDLLTFNAGSEDLSVLLGAGTGTFGNEERITIGAEPREVAVGNLNQDNRPDVFVRLVGKLQILIGQNGFLFEAPKDLVTQGNPLAMDVADFNNDGFSDIAVTFGTDDAAVQPSVVQALIAKP